MSSHLLNEAEAAGARPIWLVGEQGLGPWLEMQTPAVRSWARAQGFAAEKQKLLLIPTAAGDGIAGAALGLGPVADLSEPTLWTSAGPAGPTAAGTLSVRGHLQRGRRHAAHAGLGIRVLPLLALPQDRRPKLPALVAPAGADLEYVRLASEAPGRSARPHQYAGQ